MRAAGARAQARTIFAGFGVTGSLLAAVGVAFVVGGGVLAFDTWPGNAGDSPEQTLALAPAQASSSSASAPAVAVPAAVPAGAAAGPAGTAPRDAGRAGRRPGTRVPPADLPETPTRVDPPTTVEPAVNAPTGPATPTSAQNPVSRAVEATTAATARSIRALGAAVPVAAPVTDLLAGVVDGGGGAVRGIVRGLSG